MVTGMRIQRGAALIAAALVAAAATAGSGIDLRLDAGVASVPLGAVVAVELRAETASPTPLEFVATDAILAWDPAVLRLEGWEPPGANFWFLDGFPAVSLNNGVDTPFAQIPANDGAALYQAIAHPGESVAVDDATDPLIVRLHFRAIGPTAGTTVGFTASDAGFSSRVLGFGNQNLTGMLSDTSSFAIESGAGTLSLETPGGCQAGQGEQISIELWMRNLSHSATGFQAYVLFDHSVLAYRGDLSSYPVDDPFPLHIVPLVDAGSISAANVLHFDGATLGAGAAADHLLVTLVFDVVGNCSAAPLSFTTYANPPLVFQSQLSANGFSFVTALESSTALVLDSAPPVLSGVPADETIECPGAIPPPPAVTATDDCKGGVPVAVEETSALDGCSGTGTVTRTWTASDGCGNDAVATQIVTLVDSTAPVLSCPANVNVSCWTATPAADFSGGAVADACDPTPLVSHVGDVDNGGAGCAADPRLITRTYMAVDACGNASTCEQLITVVDDIAPTAACMDLTLELDSAGAASLLPGQIDAGTSDGCSDVTLAVTPNQFDCGDLGENPVLLTATDACGSSASCGAVVTIVDLIPPTAVCANATVALDETGMATLAAAEVGAGSADNCGVAELLLDQDGNQSSSATFSCANLGGLNALTLLVSDASGNSSVCGVNVNVVDQFPPLAACRNIAIQLDAGGTATIAPADVDDGSTDNCGSVTLTLDRTSFGCADLGPNLVMLTATDASGNSASCSATVTVISDVAPSIVCQDLNVSLDDVGQAAIDPADVLASAGDACGVASITLDRSTTFTCADLGPNVVTVTVTDTKGNSSNCQATVTVTDDLAPTAVCVDITLQLDANGEATLSPADVDGGSTDNCGSPALSLTQMSFDCADLGPNPVTLTAIDGAGNMSSCTATVTIEDHVPPVALCQNISVQLDASGTATITPSDIDGGSADACGIASREASQTSFDCSDRGENGVTLTVTDVNGNISVCVATVTILDHPDPAVCNLGDMNCDGLVTVSDIGPFVIALTDPAGYAAAFPDCDIQHGDISGDGFVTVSDIGPFVLLLTGP